MAVQAIQASQDGVQYIRKITLLVEDNAGQVLDLSELQIKFAIKQSSAQTPNAADILVYNLSEETALQVRSQFKRVILQGGYNSNYGVIFQGNIKQVIIGRQSQTETFINIIAGDGDLAYNYAVVSTTLAKGSTQNDQIAACAQVTAPLGVTAGGNAKVAQPQTLPRGKVLFGNARHYLRQVAKTTGYTWSVQNEQLQFVPTKSYLPGEAVAINAATGMVGAPQQTTQGVNVKCLLNPYIRINGRIQLDNKTVQLLKIDLTLKPGGQTNVQMPLASNGIYFVLAVEHTGDTRGLEWYTNVICLYIDSTTVFVNSVGNA
jgi:hypothetical protein